MQPTRILIATTLVAACSGAFGQQVYRCGNSYGTKPCAGGVEVEVPTAASKSDVKQAQDAARADARRAAELEKARLAREKDAPKAIVMGPVARAEAKPTPPLRKPEEFKAVSGAKTPGKGKKK